MRSALLLSCWLAASRAAAKTVWATPHDSYSSSIGVLGCKVNTDRIAYWPMSVDCSNFCVRLSYGDRSVFLLRVDQSGGAYDVSYDAWNYLITGASATADPTAGGATAMEYEDADPSNCANLIHTDDGKLPLSAANSMNFVSSCIAESNSWVGQNYALYNILDSICSWGYDEQCSLDLSKSNQASCPHALGTPVSLTSAPVYNIQYPSGKRVLASTGQVVPGNPGSNSAISARGSGQMFMVVLSLAAGLLCHSLLDGL